MSDSLQVNNRDNDTRSSKTGPPIPKLDLSIIESNQKKNMFKGAQLPDDDKHLSSIDKSVDVNEIQVDTNEIGNHVIQKNQQPEEMNPNTLDRSINAAIPLRQNDQPL